VAEFGWLYVYGNRVGGPSGSLQAAEAGNLTGSANLVYDDDEGTLNLTGNLNVSGVINANALNINVTNKNVINLSSTGSTNFGDDCSDNHIFTGSMLLSCSSTPLNIIGLPAGAASSSNHYLALDSNYNVVLTSAAGESGGLIDEYTNPGNNRIITSIDSSGINAEANLLFDGSLLSVTGAVSASVGISSSVGQYTNLTGTYIQSTTVTATNLGGTLTTAAQPNVTSVGTLTSLNVSGDVSASALFVSSSNERVGIGTNSPEKKLEIYDKDDQLRLTYSKYIPFLESNVHTDLMTNSDGYLILSSSGQRVGIGTESPTRMLDVGGDMRISGNLEVSGTLSARVTDFIVSADTITFGDSATDTLTFNAATASIPNDLNIGSNLLMLDNGNSKIGIGVQTPDAKLEVLSTTDQLKLSYDQSNSVVFVVTAGGDLDIDPTGVAITASSDLYVSGNTVLGGDSTKTTTVTGPLTASVAISSSLGQFTTITASNALITSFTDGTATITGGDISGVGTLTATNIAGTLTTAAQPNITSVGTLTSLTVAGDLTVDTDTLKVDSSTDKVGIGRTDPQKKLEVLDTSEQLRLSYSKYVMGVSENVYSDIYTNSNGYLILSSSGDRVGIGTDSPTRMLDVNGHMRVSGNLEITGSLHANVSEFIVTADNITFGQDAEDTLIFNAASGTIINGLNWDNNTFVIDSDQNRIGLGVAHPDNLLHIETTNEQFKIAYNSSNSAIIAVDSSGDLKIVPTGNYITASSGLKVSGSTFLGTDPTDNTVVSGELSASIAVSSSVGRFGELTASVITDGTAVMTGGDISNVGTLTATNVAGTLTTAAQPNVTSVGTLTSLTISGDLTVDTDTLKVNSSTDKVGIGRVDPQRKLEVLDTNPQLRLSYSKYIFGISEDVYSDIYTDSNGLLTLSGSGGKTKVDNGLNVTGLSSGNGASSGHYLALDSSNNIVLTSSVAPATETSNRRVITTNSTLTSDDYYIGVSSSSNIVFTLLDASSLPNGQTFTIKDERGNAGSIEIKILASGSQLIDNTSSVFIESPFGALNLYVDGASKYFIF
jgi:hypothetical protein